MILANGNMVIAACGMQSRWERLIEFMKRVSHQGMLRGINVLLIILSTLELCVALSSVVMGMKTLCGGANTGDKVKKKLVLSPGKPSQTVPHLLILKTFHTADESRKRHKSSQMFRILPRLADLCKYYLFVFLISFQSVDDPEVIKPLLVEATAEPEAWITTQRFTSLL